MQILVTGGAGYIGSVIVTTLLTEGHQVTVFDNFSQGFRDAVDPAARIVEGDLLNPEQIQSCLKQKKFDAVIHLAGHIQVGESNENPALYFHDNILGAINLLRAMNQFGIKRFIFSSTAAVYNPNDNTLLSENHKISPGSAYGESKYLLERTLPWLHKAHGLSYVVLRYFNACGASKHCGEAHHPETHLIPRLLQVALGQRNRVQIYGNDYPTKDGTCIRDYVHVLDIAAAHSLVLNKPQASCCTYNLGSGTGFSTLDVINIARQITGHPIPVEYAPRRPGDAAYLVASSEKIFNELGWATQYSTLEYIIQSAWDWHRTHMQGYNTRQKVSESFDVI